MSRSSIIAKKIHQKLASWSILFYLSLILTTPGITYAHSIFSKNLIQNGSAESGPGSTTGYEILDIPGWTINGNITVIQYNVPDGTPPFPSSSDPGPSNRCTNFFSGGPTNASSSISQLIDISEESTSINTGRVAFTLEGWLGGWYTQDDNSKLSATFIGVDNSILGSVLLGPVVSSERGNVTGLLLRSTSGQLPIGTTQIEVELQMTRLVGDYKEVVPQFRTGC